MMVLSSREILEATTTSSSFAIRNRLFALSSVRQFF
jgi:hypothetical protein